MKAVLAAPCLKEILRRHGSRVLLMISLLASLSVQVRFLSAGTLWDDHRIFENRVITGGISSVPFWSRGHEETKAWPLFYSFLWGLFKCFGFSFWAYHAVNSMLHVLTGALIYRIAIELKFHQPAIPPAIFLIHPLTVEATGWIFQMTKILSAFLLLLWFRHARLSTSGATGKLERRFFFIACAALTGGYAYLIGLIEAIRIPANLRRLGKWRFVLAALMVATLMYMVFLAAAGVEVKNPRSRATNAYFTLYGGVLGCRAPAEPPRLPLADLSVASAASYLLDTIGLRGETAGQTACLWMMKTASVGISAVSYLRRFFLPMPERIPSPQYSPGVFAFLGFSAVGLVILVATVCLAWRPGLGLVVLLTYLPVSGLFYFSWLDYSLTADRLIYVSLAFFTLFICGRAEGWILRSRWLQGAGVLWLLFLVVESHLRVTYLLSLYEMPFRCILCTVGP